MEADQNDLAEVLHHLVTQIDQTIETLACVAAVAINVKLAFTELEIARLEQTFREVAP